SCRPTSAAAARSCTSIPTTPAVASSGATRSGATSRSRSDEPARVRAPYASTVTRLVLVAFGGALGSVLRYLVANAAMAWMGPTFPWGTLAVNLVGSFLIGLVQSLAVER